MPGQSFGHRIDELGSTFHGQSRHVHATQQIARLEHKPPKGMVGRQVSQSAIEQAAGAATGAAGEIALFHQQGLIATRRQILHGTRSSGAPSYDTDVKALTIEFTHGFVRHLTPRYPPPPALLGPTREKKTQD